MDIFFRVMNSAYYEKIIKNFGTPMPYKMGEKEGNMDIKKFSTWVLSVEEGRKDIKELITFVKKAEKEVKGYNSTDIVINLTGVLTVRKLSIERVTNLYEEKDELKITFNSSVHNSDSRAYVKKDITIGIPIAIIDYISVEVS